MRQRAELYLDVGQRKLVQEMGTGVRGVLAPLFTADGLFDV